MPDSPVDRELVELARCGDATAFGLLLRRHQAGMHAVAVSMLGPGPDVDDAVQDAWLIALRRIGSLRDPSAVGAWLRAVVRNACKAVLRSRQAADLPLEDPIGVRADEPTPEEILGRHALRDWIWSAVGELSPPLQAAVMLRYFSGATSYSEIAALCMIPVGTVRSRLKQARTAMAQNLLATTDRAYGDAARLTAARHQAGVDMWREAEEGRVSKVMAEYFRSDTMMDCWIGPLHGRRGIGTVMYSEISAGIRQRVVRTIASQNLIVWQNEVWMNDFADPRMAAQYDWVIYLRDDRVWQARLYFTGFPDTYADELWKSGAASITAQAPQRPALPRL
jgi:RNA polymerase sigma factor (sigma-70 family)